MGASKFHFLFLVLLVTTILIIASHCSADPHDHQTKKHTAVFVFGDSLFDPGNNNYINTTTDFQANFWPYGESFFKHPTGRFSDGLLIPDFIAEFTNLPLIPAYNKPGHQEFGYGANFASGGGGALDGTYRGLVISLKTQLNNFFNVERQIRMELGEITAKQILSDAVYLFSCGGNDYIYSFETNSSSFYDPRDQEKYVDVVVGNITSVVKEIYKKGGRKFGIVGQLPIGCLPRYRRPSGQCRNEFTRQLKLHNIAVYDAFSKLSKQLEGFAYSYFNIYGVMIDIMDNPSKYGFKDAINACCGSGLYKGIYSCGGTREPKEYELCKNPNDHMIFDSVHPSQAAVKQLSDLWWHGPTNITRPHNLESLFAYKNELCLLDPPYPS